jgi:hypothetical protein
VSARVQDLDYLRSDEPGPTDDSDLHVLPFWAVQLSSRSVRAQGPSVLTPDEIFLVHEREHGLAWFAEHGDGEAQGMSSRLLPSW